jgi:hypothetical protein
MEDDLKNFKNERRFEIEDKKKLFLISLQFRGKPFLGLAQLSKILSYFVPT